MGCPLSRIISSWLSGSPEVLMTIDWKFTFCFLAVALNLCPFMTVTLKTLLLSNCSLYRYYPSMPNETRNFNPYLTQRSHGSKWMGDLRKVFQLMRGTSNWPQTTWFPNMFPQFRTRSIYFIFLCAVVCHTMGSLVTSKFLGYKRRKVNSSMPWSIFWKYMMLLN